ncbi:Uncharacterized protein Y057_12741 [Fusarium fujikuroi]|nr:Uncharacterized protein Y057_12741 [Fusarium fujikuroi]
MNIELEPRPASLAGTTPEAHNVTAESELPQADTDNGHDQTGIMSSQARGSTAQSAHSSPNENCAPERLGQEEASQSHTSQEGVDGNVHPIDLNDQILLSRIRDLLIARLRRASLDRARQVAGSTISIESRWMRDTFDADSSETPDPRWWSDDYIGGAWPASRDVPGLVQYIIKSGDQTQAHWSSRWWTSMREQNTPYDAFESAWRDWCCAARKEMCGTAENSSSYWKTGFRGKIVDYFVALQILRIIDEWLDEVQSTVDDMSKDHVLLKASMWDHDYTSNRFFGVAVRYVNEHATATKSRIQKKQEEINSLRDGLFNATSLRESTKAMALNQAIYVFTVVTVLFTPVSFLATFWALPFLNNPAEGSGTIPEPSAFRNSFIIMPILTYALVIGVAWFVGRRNSARELLDLLRRYWRILRQLMRST